MNALSLSPRSLRSVIGPICLAMAAAAKIEGAAFVVIADVQETPLRIVARMGIDWTILLRQGFRDSVGQGAYHAQ
ncbi:hypothetical protein [Consotaella salsifontis]|uniref:Uncharacterized protein n=1 Tax=Consotaella salsifontis TaxID=1365950 RepID=A0A1T4MNR6_9HYPH|nr:hypothetical protein [Consotaella salsifontis]SJZ68456.1 hypothetical protein SAMN05428963_102201 [Consotaella salsifontis]